MIESQEDERKRIAAELHDGLGQNLLLIRNRALLALEESHAEEQIRYQLNEIIDVTSRSLEEVRSIIRDLRPVKLDRLGLTHAVRSIVTEMADSSSVQITSDIDPVNGLFLPELEIHLYRVVQESLNNLVRHAHANQARVIVRRGGKTVTWIIEDDGQGFRTADGNRDAERRCSFGLSGMAQRARLLNGRFLCKSIPGRGTRIELEVPIPAERQ